MRRCNNSEARARPGRVAQSGDARVVINAVPSGLDPADPPDVMTTATTPGQGNFPAPPQYLAPPMPWPSFRHMADGELWDIVAYLQHGIKSVHNTVKSSKGPKDH